LEGHVVADGTSEKLYLLDFARLFPPDVANETKIFGVQISHDVSIPALTFTTHSIMNSTREYLFEQQRKIERPISAILQHIIAQESQAQLNYHAPADSTSTYSAPLSTNESTHAYSEADIIISDSSTTDHDSTILEPIPLDLKWLSRSEGLLVHNLSSKLPVNIRASAIAGIPIKGNAILFKNTGAVCQTKS
jgi:hypothetical protein